MKKLFLEIGKPLSREEQKKINGGGGDLFAECDDESIIYVPLNDGMTSDYTCYNGIGCFHDFYEDEYLCSQPVPEFDLEW